MQKVTVNASKTYDILIGADLLRSSGSLTAEVIRPCKACIVSDDTVAALYLDTARASFIEAGFSTEEFVFKNGEASKNTETLVNLLEFLAESEFSRSDCLVALGGGVVGDLCGFAAAVYMRGIKFVQIPTTLLAAVDSSVGGKTAVDLRAGKNLAGAFHQPSLVICDYLTLNSLPDSIFADGCAEVIKYGAINDREFFDIFKKGIKENIEEVITRCVINKRNIVEADEFESSTRKLLNLGHTVGHAIELLSSFEITHGSAVSIGMAIVTRAAVNMGVCPKDDLDTLLNALDAAALPTSCDFSADELAAAALLDKKRGGDSITLIVPFALGDSRLVKIPIGELQDFISNGLSEV